MRRVVACLVLCLFLVPLSISGGNGQSPDDELQVSIAVIIPSEGFVYEDDLVYFDAYIVKPDPIDPNTTYTFSWDFDDTTDVDLDGVFDNDNETMGKYTINESGVQHLYWSFSEPGRYNVTCTLTDGTRIVKDVIDLTIRARGVTRFDTNKDTYRPGETINVTWRVERGQHSTYEAEVWQGSLSLEVNDKMGSVVYEDEQDYWLAAGTSFDHLRFSFALTKIGEYHITATGSPDDRHFGLLFNETYVIVGGDPLYADPVARIEIGNTTIDVGAREIFSASGSYDPDGEIVSYEWDMGDGAIAYGEDISHVFTEPGHYTVFLTVQDNDDLTASTNVSITVQSVDNPSPSGITVPILSAMTIIVLTAFTVAWSTETSKVALLGLGLPLYTKLRKEKVLDDFTRGRIYGYISAFPGEHYNSIKQALDLPNGTFAHHLSVLEREGYIKSRTDRTLKRYYPMDMKVPSSEGTLKHTQVLIMKVVGETPGTSQREVAAALGLSSSTIGYHIEDLIEMGYVRKERRGMGVRYYVVDPEPAA